jgi:hypothetical protein
LVRLRLRVVAAIEEGVELEVAERVQQTGPKAHVVEDAVRDVEDAATAGVDDVVERGHPPEQELSETKRLPRAPVLVVHIVICIGGPRKRDGAVRVVAVEPQARQHEEDLRDARAVLQECSRTDRGDTRVVHLLRQEQSRAGKTKAGIAFVLVEDQIPRFRGLAASKA